MPRRAEMDVEARAGGGPSHSRTPAVGGKAGGLLRLRQAGIRVPDFEISPADLPAAIERLGLPLAVRSSAALEDGAHDSFAGQFESFLNLRSEAEVRDAVEKCRRSARTPEVEAYCRRRGIQAGEIPFDFIVQRMVQPTLAGVAFSVNPATGAEEVTIEACEGLADQLLAGAQSALPAEHPLIQQHRPQIEEAVLQAQRLFGCPQDVEFAIEDGALHVLQSRPVTKIGFAANIGQWTNADFRDGGVSSTVCSPLMASLYQWIWDDSLKRTLKEIRLYGKDFEASRMFFGRPYWNLGAVKQCLGRVPGYVEREFDTDLSVEIGYEGDGQVTPTNWRTLLGAAPVAWGISRFFKRQRAAARRLLEGGWQTIGQRYESSPGWDEAALRRLLESDYYHVETTYFRTVFAVSLAKLDFKLAFPDADYASLVAGLPPLSHMAPQRSIEACRRRGDDAPSVVQRLMSEFRHHCRWGVDVIHARWDEDRPFVESLVGCDASLDVRTPFLPGAQRDPQDTFQHARQAALGRLPRRRRASFARKLQRLREFVWLREELRDVSNRAYYVIRRAAVSLGEQRFLNDDVFFMTWRQLLDDDRSAIQQARAVYEGHRHFDAPNEIGVATAAVGDEPAADAASWRGIGVSGGSVTAVARVALTVEEAMAAEPGSVLVCPFTEPGWTPALSRASAVITETGGLLSHAAVICREFGLPAVLAIPQATRRIPDGCQVVVNGSDGVVRATTTLDPANGHSS